MSKPKPQLNELFEWLQRNERNRFEIYDVGNEKVIQKCASYTDLTSGGNTLEQYFTGLFEKGISSIQIRQKKKNGSSWVPEGCGVSYNYSLSTDAENNVAARGRSESPAATQQPYQPGLMGSPSNYGLGLPEIMNMRSNADRFEETRTENRELKAKLERLESENRKLETECLTYKLGADSKPSAVDKLVEALAANPAVIPSMIQSIKGGGSNPGLNAPQLQEQGLTETQKMVIDAIKKHPDQNVLTVYHLLHQAEQNNVGFLKKYNDLLIEFNIISNGSDSESDRI